MALHRGGSLTWSRVLPKTFCSPQTKRKMKAYYRPEEAEQDDSHPKIQDGDCPICDVISHSDQLCDQHRLRFLLFIIYSDSPKQQEVSQDMLVGRVFQFRALPFGLSSAPWIFTKSYQR